MQLPKLSPKQKAALCVAMALLLWIPSGISQQTQPVVTGHSTFYNGDTYDPCLASIAGIVRSRVMWFNDQVLVERYPGKGTFVYVTEQGGMDPTKFNYLYSEGVSYNFVDPNGAPWHVEELYGSTDSPQGDAADTADQAVHNTPNPETYHPIQNGGTSEGVTVNASASFIVHKQYVWVVELAAQPIFDQFPGGDPHSYYNFLDIVDTCKMDPSTPHYNITHDGSEPGHDPNGPRPHNHTVYQADLYLGAGPTIVPAGIDSSGANYNTEWATSGNPQTAAGSAAKNPSGTAASQAGATGGG